MTEPAEEPVAAGTEQASSADCILSLGGCLLYGTATAVAGAVTVGCAGALTVTTAGTLTAACGVPLAGTAALAVGTSLTCSQAALTCGSGGSLSIGNVPSLQVASSGSTLTVAQTTDQARTTVRGISTAVRNGRARACQNSTQPQGPIGSVCNGQFEGALNVAYHALEAAVAPATQSCASVGQALTNSCLALWGRQMMSTVCYCGYTDGGHGAAIASIRNSANNLWRNHQRTLSCGALPTDCIGLGLGGR